MAVRNEAVTFLNALLQGTPSETTRYFYLWKLATKQTSSFAINDPAAAEAATTWSSEPRDLYVGVGLGRGVIPESRRLTSSTAAGLFGLYLDVDVAGPAHQKQNLPPTMEAAVDLLEEFGTRPTMVVASGHGLQAWWLFDQPWVFESDGDRIAAATLTKGWVDAHRSVASLHGWDHDAVGDLARLLRLPGTVNAKDPQVPVDVGLLYADGPRHSPEDLARVIEAQRLEPPQPQLRALPPATPQGVPDHEFDMKADAEPPADKLEALLRHPGAAGSWEHHRPDFQDQSPSSFDLSLASLALQVGWEDPEVVDLLIACRRRNHVPLKLRADYYLRTLDAARAGAPEDEVDRDEEPSFRDECKGRGVVPALADIIEDAEHFAQDEGGNLLRYGDGRYVPAEHWVAREVRGILEDRDATKEWRDSVTRHLANYMGLIAPKLWDRPPTDTINVENGLVEVATGTLAPHSASYLTSVQLPIQFDVAATCPAIDQFVHETFPEDAFDLAFELLALAMVPDPSIQKVVLLLGSGGNGKSVFLRLMQRFIGPENYSTVPLQRLEDDRFSASRVHGKLANICADLPASDLQDSSMLKSITGGDHLTVERKYHDSYNLHPFCKLFFSANEPPRTPDASEGFFQRWVVVPFDRSFRNEDTEVPSGELDARLQAPEELSGALNRALAARRSITTAGLFEPLSTIAAREAFRAVTDPVSVWIDQQTLSAPGAFVLKSRLLEEYNSHAISVGRPIMTAQRFGRALHRSRPDLQPGQRSRAGKRVEAWLDITLRSDAGGSADAGASGAFTNNTWGA